MVIKASYYSNYEASESNLEVLKKRAKRTIRLNEHGLKPRYSQSLFLIKQGRAGQGKTGLKTDFKSAFIDRKLKFKGKAIKSAKLPVLKEYETPLQSMENRVELEENFDRFVKETWNTIFSKNEIEQMKELSKDLLESNKKMRELTKQLNVMND